MVVRIAKQKKAEKLEAERIAAEEKAKKEEELAALIERLEALSSSESGATHA